MKNLLKFLLTSIKNEGEASIKKVIAYIITWLVFLSHFWWFRYAYYKNDFTLFPIILGLDFGFIAACIGLKTYEQVQKIKNKTENGKEEQ